jgi:RHS repeat-associated protein
MAIVSVDGTVSSVFNGQPAGFLQVGQAGQTDIAASVDVTQSLPNDPAATHYFLADQVGTTQMELSSGRWPVWRGDFAPFGQELDTQSTTNHYKFTGKERDAESGLDYFGARYYASNMGRWMSPDWSAKEDPVPYAKLDDPQSLNLYGYVGNNPLARADADGHCAEDACVVEGGVAAVAFVALTASAYLSMPSTQRSLSAAASSAAGTISSAFHSIFSKAAPAAAAAEQPRTADGKFAPKEGGEANPGAAAEAAGLSALGAVKNVSEKINGTIRDGTIPATGEHAEIKSGKVIADTKQLAAMGAAAVAKTGKALVVGATHPNVTVTKPAAQNPDLNIKKIPQ